MTSIPWNFSWFIDGKLAGMAYPRDKHIPFLVASGLQTIINLTPFPADYEDMANAHGITVHNIIIEDFCAPSYDQIKEFLDICKAAETVSSHLTVNTQTNVSTTCMCTMYITVSVVKSIL